MEQIAELDSARIGAKEIEQEFNKEKKKDHDKEDDQKGVELKIDIEDNPFTDDEEE